MSGKNANLRYKYLHWQKLDNSAHVFPVIAGEKMTNTYRICAELKDDVDGAVLQKALDAILPKFPLFNVRLRRGFFWYYLEENGKRAPRVRQETGYPCQYIHAKLNQDYLFRVTYYKRRINLEVFHVLTDGMGAAVFLKEILYQYLRLKHPELVTENGDDLSAGTSLNLEDSFLRNYRKKAESQYASDKAFRIKGEKLQDQQLGILHCILPLAKVRETAHGYGLSINEYLVSVFVWSIYEAYAKGESSRRAIRVAVPVNLRTYFDSTTTKNFFVMVSAEFMAEDREYTFPDVVEVVKRSLKEQLVKEHLEEIFSYNVSRQRKIFNRAMPIWVKNIAIRAVYSQSALANTTTMTNIGRMELEEAYTPYVENFYGMLAMSKGQPLKATVCSFEEKLTVTFSSILRETLIQKIFCRQLVADEIPVEIETNGVYYE
ncbi:MAG: hypothetical protein ACI39H_00735 [Lachnospiraceae bacterium]